MKTVHIIRFGYREYAFESVAKVTRALELFSGMVQVSKSAPDECCSEWHYKADDSGPCSELELKMNQRLYERPKYKALPKPKRGSKRCSCGHSDVAPGESCVSCGLAYNFIAATL